MNIQQTVQCLVLITLVNFTLSANAEEKISSEIYVNQLGYLPAAEKIALVSSPLPLEFQLTDIETGKVILKRRLQLAEAGHSASGANLWKANFTSIQKPSRYEIHIPGFGKSYPIPIAAGVYNRLATQSLKAFYYLRSATAIEPAYTYDGERSSAHNEDGKMYAEQKENQIKIDASGGWYDGSDIGKYTINGAVAVGTLLLLHERLPNAFPDRSLNIPESGNQIPDILDQAKWEIDWLLKMQDADGGVYHKLTSLEPVLGVLPKEDKTERFLFAKSTAATANACAVFAKASRLYFPHNATFASSCMLAARDAWRFLEANPNDGGFQNPPAVRTEAYTDPDDSDERFWAAVELYLTTDDQRFSNLAAVIADRRVPLFSTSGYWGNVMPLAFGSIISNITDEDRFTILSEVEEDLVSMAETIHDRVKQDGFNMSIKENNYTWGSNAAVLQNALVLLLSDDLNPEAGYKQSALDQLHYILGRNPRSFCYITGFGEQSPKHPHNLHVLLENTDTPIPGFLVGGPNASLNDSALKRQFSANTPPALTYLDVHESFASNEVSLNWNAVLTFVLAYFMQNSS